MSEVKVDACRLDLPDDRDLVFIPEAFADRVGGSILTDIQYPITLPEKTPISNQGTAPTCVNNAVCDAFETIMDSKSVVQLSRLFGHWNSLRQHGDEQDPNSGTYIRTAMWVASKLGLPPESMWPYDVTKLTDQPPLSVYEAAWDHRIVSYERITSRGPDRLDEIDIALSLGHPIVLSMEVGKSFEQYVEDGSMPGGALWHAPSHPIGRHAMVIVGVRLNNRGDARHYMLRNSWGYGWGMGGYAWASEDWVSDPMTNDLWVPTVAPMMEEP